ncbi:hypothetical protein F3Y22_tig00110332pilonHSYRG00548 [Hibiscus syriacus]|uniref:Uncharacterized protein n=1 Tax=Hibiscus syriacus TaxID=106335 RepID=A0A6A3B108_HIBSY|nr:hypothetical protein F3Y22_tig00110332pilonHSYRG00548 [Hibiscus syriacus]
MKIMRSHVPKSGEWEDDDLPDTTYLENAGKEKGGKMMNPNDSKGNSDAFLYMRGGQEGNNDFRHDHAFRSHPVRVCPNRHTNTVRVVPTGMVLSTIKEVQEGKGTQD